MADLIRSAKPGSDWTEYELRAYNMEVVPENVVTFFGDANLPPPTISPAILAHETYPAAGLPIDERLFYDLLEEAMTTPSGEESAVDDFAAHLLRLLGYAEPDRRIRTRTYIPLIMCTNDTYTKTDVCIDDRSHIRRKYLLLQEDKRHVDGKDPEPQLIAQAIAAFQSHNIPLRAIGVPHVNAAVIPGITMVGTAPTFYKINVNTALNQAVEYGEYPLQTTIVHKLVPPVQAHRDFQRDGMRPLDNRAMILLCFEAFKRFL